MTESDDGRLDLLHASILDRVNACRGSWTLEHQLPPDQLAPSSSYARSGTKIAQWLAREAVELTPEEMTTAIMCREDEDAAILEWGPNQELWISREKRYYLREKLVPRMSAKPDFVAIASASNRALILNHKSGRLEPEASPRNLQLRAEAVCVHSTYPKLTEITVGIVQPWVRRKVALVSYDVVDLAKATEGMLELVSAVADPEAPLALNDWCRFCPAVAICPLVAEHMNALSIGLSSHSMTLSAGIALLSPSAKFELFKRIKMLEPAFRQIVSTLALEVERNPDSIPGLRLKSGDRTRKITDATGAANIFSYNLAVSDEELEATKSMSVTKLEELYGRKRKLTGKALRSEFNRTFDPVIEYVSDKPTLVES